MKETSYLHGQEELVERFRKLPFLKGFKDEYLREILRFSKLRRYDANELIIPENSQDGWVYTVISGSVLVVKEGKEIARLEAVGDTFGEMAIIDGSARCASVHAAADTICLAFDTGLLDQMKPEDQSGFYLIFYRMLAEILANRLRLTNRELLRVKNELELYQLTYRWGDQK